MLVLKHEPSILGAIQPNMRIFPHGGQMDMFMTRGALLETYQHLLCDLRRARDGLFTCFLMDGIHKCICLVHLTHRIIVPANDVGTRHRKIQVNNQNAHCLGQVSSIWRVANALARVTVALSLLFMTSGLFAVSAFAVGIPNLHSLGLCIHQAL